MSSSDGPSSVLPAFPEHRVDLEAWEPVAGDRFLRLPEWHARFLARDMADLMTGALEEMVLGAFREWAAEVGEAGNLDADASLRPALAGNILRLRGVDDLDGFWRLGEAYRRAHHWLGSPEWVLEQFRRGVSAPTVEGVLARGLPVTFVDAWAEVLTVADLRLCLDAGLTTAELEGALVAGEVPDRAGMATLAGLRSGCW